MAHVKLHIPGPVEVSEKTFRAFCSPMIGHRGQGFKDLYAKIQPQLQQLLYTKRPVYISTSSAWGVMEGAIRNLVAKKVLNCMCGAFSDKWFDVSKRCGKQAQALQVPWGSPIRAAEVDKLLATHRRLTGPRRDPTALPADHEVLEESHTDVQSTFVVRCDGPILDPAWTVEELSLEDLVLAYMSRARSGASADLRRLSVLR